MLYIKDKSDIGKLMYEGKPVGVRLVIREIGYSEVVDLSLDTVRNSTTKEVFEYIIAIGKPIKLIDKQGVLATQVELAQNSFVVELNDQDKINEVLEYIENMMLEG